MKGMLLGAFCERGGEGIRCLELWAYPDTSLNIVVNRYGPEGEEEYAFPCAAHHLVNVLRERPFVTESGDGTVTVERREDNLHAEYRSATEARGWTQSVPVEPFACALALVAPEAESFS